MCLRVYDEQLTWYEAHNFCSKSGYSLALVDNFELEKKMNKILFDDDDLLLKSLFGLNQTVNAGKKLKNFWLGIRHLNSTSWFDPQNNPLSLRSDEQKWWPWLVVDSKTYTQGSCVGKRRNWLFLEDCYKRMPFACQTNKLTANENVSRPPTVEFKCGKSAGFTSKNVPVTTQSTPQSSTTKFKYQPAPIRYQDAVTAPISSVKSSSQLNKLVRNSTRFSKVDTLDEQEQHSSSEVNLALFTVKKNVAPTSLINNGTHTDSSTIHIYCLVWRIETEIFMKSYPQK